MFSASTLHRDSVVNRESDDPSDIEEQMIDLTNGRNAHAILSFGGLIGVGDELFAIPWQAITVDEMEERHKNL